MKFKEKNLADFDVNKLQEKQIVQKVLDKLDVKEEDDNDPLGPHTEAQLVVTDSNIVCGLNGHVVLVPLNFRTNPNPAMNKTISLPGCGFEKVSVLVNKNYIYAGSNGYVYRLDLDGANIVSNSLPKRGNHETRLAITDSHLVIGTHGYIELVPLSYFDQKKPDPNKNSSISLPHCGYQSVSVLVHGNYIYAGSNGYAYRLELDGANVILNSLSERGHAEVRLAITESHLVIGTNGFLELISLDYFDKPTNPVTNKSISLPGCGYESVSVLVSGEHIFAGSNGYAYMLDLMADNIDSNSLPGRGHHDTRLAFTGKDLIVGTNGFIVGISQENFSVSKDNTNHSLKGTGYEIVTLYFDSIKLNLFAASGGLLFGIDLSTEPAGNYLFEREVSAISLVDETIKKGNDEEQHRKRTLWSRLIGFFKNLFSISKT